MLAVQRQTSLKNTAITAPLIYAGFAAENIGNRHVLYNFRLKKHVFRALCLKPRPQMQLVMYCTWLLGPNCASQLHLQICAAA